MPPLVNRHSHRVGRNRAGRARVPRYTTEGPPRPDPSSSCGCGTPCQRRSRGGPQRPRGPRARPRLARQSRSSCRRTLSCCPIRSLQRHGDHRTAVQIEALVHDSKLTVNDPNPEASHRPILYDSGRPSSVIWFRTLHATTDSATRPPRDRARSRSPIIDLYRKNAFSTRAWSW